MIVCHCGKAVWEYDAATWTCKAGHHSPREGAVVERIASPDPARFTLSPSAIGALTGVGTSVLLFVAEHLLF